jgi:hypothetical protein
LTDYEKGVPSWDIAAILTRHLSTLDRPCARVANLRETVGRPATERLQEALDTKCNCGIGDSPAEQTSIKTTLDRIKEVHIGSGPATRHAG